MRKPPADYSLAALSGLLLSASFAPSSLGWTAWVALTPLFLAVLGAAGPGRAFLLGGTAGLVFYSVSLSWMTDVVHYLAPVFWCVFAAWMALHAALVRGLWEAAGRHPSKTKVLYWACAAGLCWAGIEYFRSEVWALECPWLGLGYSQTFVPPFFQSLSVWGVYGLSAFIAAANAAWALALKRRRMPAAVFLAAALAAAGLGTLRLSTSGIDLDGRPLRAALVQAEREPLDGLIGLSLSTTAARSDLLVWPECSVMMPEEASPSYAALIARGLRGYSGEAVIGGCVPADRARGVSRANFAMFFGRGGLSGVYDKMHPVQFVETGLPSNRKPEPAITPLGRLGPQICYDLAFENGSRAMASRGAELIVTPTLDPEEWGALQHTQHSDMTAARAVETGLWIVRAASSGRSQIIDPLGRERALLANGTRGVLSGEARLRTGGTFYTRAGWLLGPFALLFTAGAALFVFIRKRI
ncbi:MAG: hypothetical protein M0011_04170 [Elusimicrobia bacterium]|nr:hypothetical protein [Elusimicrobiota bacterium]